MLVTMFKTEYLFDCSSLDPCVSLHACTHMHLYPLTGASLSKYLEHLEEIKSSKFISNLYPP